MPIQGGVESNGGKRRAVLLLSLILLVWNAFVTARHVAPVGHLPSMDRTDGSPVLPSASDDETAVLSAESPRSGPSRSGRNTSLGNG